MAERSKTVSIPKIIHYCWFGGNIPAKFEKYIDQWRKKCPDYELKLWNENSFDLSSVEYLKKAVKAGRWAFVADYVRLAALYQYGGIYLDTDVELLGTFDSLLDQKLVFGFETSQQINGAIILAEKEKPFIREVLDLYEGRCFEGKDIVDTMIPIPYVLSKMVEQKGAALNGDTQTVGGITLLSRDYFYPLSFEGEGRCFTKNTIAIHQYAGSWSNNITKLDVFLKKNFSISIQPIIKGLSKLRKTLMPK